MPGRTQEALYAEIDLELSWSEDELPQLERTKHVHSLHPYLGKFVPQLVEVFLGRYFALHQWRGRRLQRLLALLPYLIPNFILASAYVIAWNPASGLLNAWLSFPLVLYCLPGMFALFAVSHAPVALLMP